MDCGNSFGDIAPLLAAVNPLFALVLSVGRLYQTQFFASIETLPNKHVPHVPAPAGEGGKAPAGRSHLSARRPIPPLSIIIGLRRGICCTFGSAFCQTITQSGQLICKRASLLFPAVHVAHVSGEQLVGDCDADPRIADGVCRHRRNQMPERKSVPPLIPALRGKPFAPCGRAGLSEEL